MLAYLKKAAPWMRFIGILGFIGSGLVTLGGLVAMVFIPVSGYVPDELSDFGEHAGLIGVAAGLYFILLAALYFFPSLYAYRFGAGIRDYLSSGVDQHLEIAFRSNKSLWKFQGILAIAGLALIPLAVIAGIIAIVAAALA
jgi:hypothetical protein